MALDCLTEINLDDDLTTIDRSKGGNNRQKSPQSESDESESDRNENDNSGNYKKRNCEESKAEDCKNNIENEIKKNKEFNKAVHKALIKELEDPEDVYLLYWFSIMKELNCIKKSLNQLNFQV